MDDIISPLIELTPDEWDVLQRLVDEPPAPSPRLVELLRQHGESSDADPRTHEG